MTTAAFLVPAILAWMYSVGGGIEFGLPTAWLVGSIADRKRLEHYFSPVWETTNVLAVMALTSFVVLFPVQLSRVSDALRGPLILTGGLILGRALLVLVVFYLKKLEAGWVTVLAGISLLLPAVLFQLPLRLIDGANPGLLPSASWALFGIASSIALGSALFVRRDTNGSKLVTLARWSTLLAVAIGWASLVVVLPNRSDYLVGNLSNWWWLVVIGPLVIALLVAITKRTRLLLPGLLLSLAGLWLFIFIHQSPYLLFPSVTQAAAITNSQTTTVALGSIAFFTLVLLPFGVWLYGSALSE